jgi:hypothetical protein
MRAAAVLTPNGAFLRPGQAVTSAAAAETSARRGLVAIIARLVAAHRARQVAAVDRVLRSGLAAID